MVYSDYEMTKYISEISGGQFELHVTNLNRLHPKN